MEGDVPRLFRKLVKTLSAAIIWLMVNNIIGLYLGWMFFHGTPTLGNYIFYVFLLGTLTLLILYFIKVWKEYI